MSSFETFETFVKNRPGMRLFWQLICSTYDSGLVIKTFEKELLEDGLNALKPLERTDEADGVAHPDEVKQVVVNRSGSILSASTILKSDFFSNLQKMTLTEYTTLSQLIIEVFAVERSFLTDGLMVRQISDASRFPCA